MVEPLKTVWQSLIKLNIHLLYDHNPTHLWVFTQGKWKHMFINKDLYEKVYSNFIHICQRLETPKWVSGWMDRPSVVCLCQTPACTRTDESQKHVLTERNQMQEASDIPFTSFSWKDWSMETEARGHQGMGWGKDWFGGHQICTRLSQSCWNWDCPAKSMRELLLMAIFYILLMHGYTTIHFLS